MYRLGFSKSKSTSIKAFTRRVVFGLRGSFEVTVIVFDWFPFLDFVLKVTLIDPSPPGGIAVLVMTAAVHPQEPLALINRRGASPVFLTLKTWETLPPRGMVPKS